jgi:hypothetical protein
VLRTSSSDLFACVIVRLAKADRRSCSAPTAKIQGAKSAAAIDAAASRPPIICEGNNSVGSPDADLMRTRKQRAIRALSSGGPPDELKLLVKNLFKPIGSGKCRAEQRLSAPTSKTRIGSFRSSFDYLVGAGENSGRHGDAERFRGLDVDDHSVFGRLLDRQVSRLFPLENFVDVGCGTPIEII